MHAISSKQSEKKKGLPAISKAFVLRSLLRTTLPAARSSSKNSSTARSTMCLPGWIFYFSFCSLFDSVSKHASFHSTAAPAFYPLQTLWQFRKHCDFKGAGGHKFELHWIWLPTRHCPNSNNEPWEWKQAYACLARAWMTCSFNVFQCLTPLQNLWQLSLGYMKGFTRWKKIKIKAKVGGWAYTRYSTLCTVFSSK